MMNLTLYNWSNMPNVGDRCASPHLYFDWLKDVPVKPVEQWQPGPSLFGGGGLLHPGGDWRIHQAFTSAEKAATWAIGINYHDCRFQNYPKFLDLKADTVGLREPGNPWTYVPCPSCMAKEFDAAAWITPTTRVVVYEHASNPFRGLLPTVPAMTNGDGPLDAVLAFLAGAELVVTNSFHGLYWAGLLGRRAISFEPNSNRFMAFWSAPVAVRGNLRAVVAAMLKETEPRGIETLADARQRNQAWSAKLEEYFKDGQP